MNCPRCNGRVLRELGGERVCFACGHEVYHPMEVQAARRQLELDAEQRESRTRVRPVMHMGMRMS
jgi:uncharacterized Zn finger protein (UPF0148 family)